MSRIFKNIYYQKDKLNIKDVYEENYQAVFDFVNKLTTDEQITKDIVQDTFHKLMELSSFDEIKNMKAYLISIAKNLVFDQIRHQKKAITLQIETDVEVGTYDIDGIKNAEVEQIKKSLLEKLPLRTKKIYEMSRFRKLTYKEIAFEMGISTVAVKKQIMIAYKSLRQNLRLYLE